MLKSRLSIKTVVALAFVLLSGSLILGYSLLSARFFSQGVIRVIKDNMETGVDTYHRSMAKGGCNAVDYFGNLMITRQWRHMPSVVRRTYPRPVPVFGKLYLTRESQTLNRSDPNYYVMAVPRGDAVYFVCQWIGFSTPPGIIGWNSSKNIRFLIVVSCCMGMAVAAALWLVTRRISLPMANLSLWANGLDKQKVKDDLPDFYYKELNDLAGLIREKITAEQEAIARDREFLHYASHELRTPITVICQNIEVLKKARALDTLRARQMEQNAVKRLAKASDNMGALMETLLWLGRKTTRGLPETPVCLERLLTEIVESLGFLLDGKPVAMDLKTEAAVITAPEAPLRIVLSNLVRNAFHHTARGAVAITQSGRTVTIVNNGLENHGVDSGHSPGFGFGLSLTTKLIDRMGWSCRNESGASEYKVIIFF